MIGERLTARAAAVAERRCRRVAAEVARDARAAGVTAAVSGNDVVLSGKRLAARWLSDSRLRFLGWQR